MAGNINASLTAAGLTRSWAVSDSRKATARWHNRVTAGLLSQPDRLLAVKPSPVRLGLAHWNLHGGPSL